MRTSSFLHYLCTLLLLAESAEAQLLAEPRLASKIELPNLTFKRGNALTEYSGSVVATTAEGSLVRVNPSDQSIMFSFTPDSIADRTLSCLSGIALLRDVLAIYAVIDAATDDAGTSSRVLCVNLEDGTLVWSASVAGRVIGTPLMSEDLLYVVHNEDVGKVTVLRLADAGEPATVGTYSTEDTTLGPASLISVNNQDVLAVASNLDNGFSAEGGLYMLIEQQMGDGAQQGGAGGKEGEGGGKEGGGGGKEGENKDNQAAPFRFILASTFPRSSVTAPLLSENMELVMAEQGASLTAWAGENDLSDVLQADFKNEDMTPGWQRFVDENPDDGNAPIMAKPIFSATGEMVYVASAGPQFTAVMLQDGVSAWSVDTESIIKASPVLGEDVVYTIESNGRVSQYDVVAGSVKWVMGCDIAGTCGSNVEANFALSETGNELYFGDTNGNIISILVGGDSTFAPTSSPVLIQPEVPAPTRAPTEKTQPTNEPLPADPVPDATDVPRTASPTVATIPGEVDQQNPNNDEKKTSGYVAGAVVSVAAFIVAFAVCLVCRRKATSEKDLNSELKAQQLAYEQACRNAEKEALEEIMRDRRNEESMEQSATETFFYGDQTLATPMSMSIPGMSLADTYYQKYGQDKGDSDGESEEQIGFEVAAGEKQISPVYARPSNSTEKATSKVSKSQQPEDSSVRHTPSVPPADIESGIEDDEEPGRIVFRDKSDDEANESQRSPSPAYSDVMSDDDSLYTTEEPRPMVSRYISDDPKQMIGRSFSKDSSFPDDESSKASAFPGITSYFRTPSKKPTLLETAKEPLRPEVNAARPLAHAGVSVRQAPSKSRAGLFSRRSPALVNKPSPTNDIPARNTNITGGASQTANHSPPESKQTYEAFQPEHIPASAPPPELVPVSPPPEEEKAAPSPSSDVWNSFLSELSKAEKSFFGSSDKISRPPSPPPPPPPMDRSDSPPPPPPPSSGNNQSAGASGGNKGYFWV